MTRWWRSHSVRMRLTLWYVGAMGVVLGVYVFAVIVFVSRSVSDALDMQLRQDFVWVYASLYQTDSGEFMLNEPEQLDPEAGLPWVQVWRSDRSRLLLANPEAQRRPVPESRSIRGEGIISLDADTGRMRILTQRGELRTQLGAVADARVVIQVGRPEAPMQQQVRELTLMLILGLPVALAVAGLGGYTVARRALAPIERMTAHARTITASRLSDRLPVDNPEDEMGRLAAVFNETLSRLEASFEQMRRFTADVSHELRTPLTSIRSVGEVGLRGHRDDAAYRGIIGSMLEEADRLATLVDRLLTLSRAETRQAKLSAEPVDLEELANNVASHLGVLAEEKRQAIVIDREGGPERGSPPDEGGPVALGDRVAVRQALISLVDNAIKFTPPGGQIRIRLADTPQGAVIDVIDSGPGVPADARPRIFDRFYRADGMDAGGTGLGLSIARGNIEANGGRLTLEETGPRGSIFRITMPRVAFTPGDLDPTGRPGSAAGGLGSER